MDSTDRSPRQLTDDNIDDIVYEIHEWFIRHPLGTTEEGYDWFRDFAGNLLEPFSNGYRNYN